MMPPIPMPMTAAVERPDVTGSGSAVKSITALSNYSKSTIDSELVMWVFFLTRSGIDQI